MTTLSLEILANVAGGAGETPETNANLNRLEGCKQWAESQHVGKDFKSALCDKEFVRRSFDSFAPTPGVTRRQPL